MKKLQTKAGFTLAEVLITLAIIGVVAAISIPTLLQDTSSAKYATAWKKAYAELSQMAMKAKYDNGGTFSGLFTNANAVVDLIENNMSTLKKCSSGTALTTNCWASSTTYSGATELAIGTAATGGIVLANGTTIAVGTPTSACTGTTALIAPGTTPATETTTSAHCVSLVIDINGMTGPNKTGKDIYGAVFLSDRLIPYGPSLKATVFESGGDHEEIGASSTSLYE